jgi:hypothetical protein
MNNRYTEITISLLLWVRDEELLGSWIELTEPSNYESILPTSHR